MMQLFTGRSVSFSQIGAPSDWLFVLPTFSENGLPDDLQKSWPENAPGFTLALIPVDWNRELSPWPYEGGGRLSFAGEGERLLDFLPHLSLGDFAQRALVGYSLAGLFALWAMTMGADFSAFGSCSGSLWYPGFTEHLEKHPPQKPCRVYLSLGEREERAKNPLFAAVGSATRRTAEILKNAPLCTESTLVMHEGGHGTDANGRITACIQWLIRRNPHEN